LDEAQRRVADALGIRRGLHHEEPGRADLAEELGYTLYLSEAVNAGGDYRAEVISALAPFARAGAISARGAQILHWASDSDDE